MATLQDIVNLAKADGGKFFVIDETGNPQLVIMGVGDYQKLLLGKISQQVEDIEQINREILRAQMQEVVPAQPSIPQPPLVRTVPSRDLREEVIDPSFDFEGPKIEIDDL